MPGGTRKRIVEAAYEVLAREGYDATSIKDIAAAAGVAAGLVHYYFRSKEDLVLAAIEWGCQGYAANPGGGTPEEVAMDALGQARRDLSEHRDFHRLLFDMFGVGMHNPAVAEALRQFLHSERAHIEQLAREMLAQRENRSPDDVPAIATAVWGGIFGIYLQSLIDPDLDAGAAIDAFGRMVMTST